MTTLSIKVTALLAGIGCLGCGNSPTTEPADMLDRPQTSLGTQITPITARSDRTTPSELELHLDDLVDFVAVQVFVTDESGNIVTGCHTAKAWRIGPNASDWPRGAPITLPLDYTETLPLGRYVERVRLYTHSHRADLLQDERGFEAGPRRFEVTSTGIVPITDYIPSDVSSPCPAFPVVADEVPLDQATTVVDADDWHHAGSIQPIRWNPSDSTSPDAASVFYFSTWTVTRNKLRFLARVAPSFDPPTDVTVSLDGEAELKVYVNPVGASDLWTSKSGQARIREDAPGQWSITLSNVELANDLTGDVGRVTPSGSITGQLLYW